MEAMFVSPAPGPKAFKPQSNSENQSGTESTFAPTLDQAIDDNKISSPASSEKSRPDNLSKTHNTSKDIFQDSDLSEDTPPQASGVHNFNVNTEQISTTVPGHRIAAAAKEAAALLQNGEARFSSTQKGEGNSIARQAVSSSIPVSHIYMESLENTQTQKVSATTPELSAENEKRSVVAAQFTQTLNNSSSITKQHVAEGQLQRPGNSVYLQNNDTISWNQSKQAQSNMLSQNTHLLQIVSDESPVNSSSAIRVERFSAPSEIIGQNATENTEKILPLSVERIAAKLSDIPIQTNHATMSLRENVSSLRQDSHEQFTEAKLEYIDKKQHGQADQQSLGSESESTQKNALAASPKSLDKGNESSFSQSLHTISTDKTINSPMETMRPGGSVFTSHVQETNILHQVLHKFRISQHLQDSRLVMKLHPAELGDLKIDVHLKDGTINANILAQTQQAQDILEKNMPRLKALMEEQGLTVNEITINLDTDVSDNKNMFEEHLSQDAHSFAKRKDMASSVQFELEQEIVEEAEFGPQPSPSGVNVMI